MKLLNIQRSSLRSQVFNFNSWIPVLSAALFSLCSLTYSHAGVFAHYSFDADYNDSSGLNRHGTLVDVGTAGNSAITTAVGESKFGGGAMNFSSDRDYVSLPTLNLYSRSAYTIAFWAKKNDATRAWNTVIGERNTYRYYIASRGSGDGNLTQWRSSRESIGRHEDFPTPSDTDWHHYAVVSGGLDKTLKFYLDGVLVATKMNQIADFTIDTIGAAHLVTNDYDFEGCIDEVWLLDGAADAAMISSLYNNNDPGFPAPVVDATVTKLRIVLVAGQSNAEGHGLTSELPTLPVNLQSAQDDVDFFYKEYLGTGNFTKLYPARAKSATATATTNGKYFGPEITLGRRLADLYSNEANTRIAIVKYAKGGTQLASHWKPGGDSTVTGDGSEYKKFQLTVDQALAAFAVAYPNANLELAGMAWVQGESDAARTASADSYEVNLIKFIAGVRATYSPKLPFHIFRLSTTQTHSTTAYPEGFSTVRTAQENVANGDRRASFIDADTCPVNGDNIHFSAAGQQLLGKAFADKIAYYIWMSESFSDDDIDAGKGEPSADPDGDGNKNLNESQLSTDPLSRNPAFGNVELDLAIVDDMKISYATSIDRNYTVESYNTDSKSWVEFLPGQQGTGVRVTRDLGSEGAHGMFRVRSELR